MPDRLRQALLHHQRGELSQAAQLYREMLAETPTDVEALQLLGDIEYQQGRREGAVRLRRMAIGPIPNRPASDQDVVSALEERKQLWQQLQATESALASMPNDAQAFKTRGNALLALKRPAEALESYDRALTLQPDYSAAIYNRAIVLLHLKRPEDALAALDRALALEPNDPEALTERGNALLDLKRAADAVVNYDHALALAPYSMRALYNRGLALVGLERFEEALASYDRALACNPALVAALEERGNVLRKLGRPLDALASYERALALEPDNAGVLEHRGHTLLDLARQGDALTSYDRALAIDPDNVELLVHRGIALMGLKRPEEALASYDRALAISPDYPIALNNRGLALVHLQRTAEALTSFDRALALEPALGETLNNRGNALRDMKRYDDALASYERALALKPESAVVHRNLGMVLRELRRFEDATKAFARSIAIAPEHGHAIGDLVNCMLECSNWEHLPRYIHRVVRAIEAGEGAALPFAFLSMSQSLPAQLKCARTFVANGFPAVSHPLWTGARYHHEKIRVAYLSADFHEHATAYLMAELFELHDKQRFERTAISFGPASAGAMRERLQRSFDRFVDVRAQTDREVAELLHDLAIDIAVDLKGYTGDCRPGILSYRPAPIQVNYLGYPGTMGADYIDYIIADAHVIPPEHDAYYTEKVVRLPDSYQVNDSRRVIAQRTPTRAEVNLPHAGFVFCCFNSNYKITPDIFDIWMRLLKAVDGSVLWLLERNASATPNLRREAERRGVAPTRLIFAPRMRLGEHLARHRLADLFLDTLPCNAHTTASDALWAGLPVLTCMGDAFAARVGGSLLNAVGLPELVTRSLPDYESMAQQLATTPPMLAALRARLATNLASCPLFDTDRFRRHLESAYTMMWERYQRNEPPATIAVEPIE